VGSGQWAVPDKNAKGLFSSKASCTLHTVVMRELLSQTWSNLSANKLRSFLTMFGIIWGVISIVILSATGEGFQRGNQAVFREFGKNIVIIGNGRTSLQAGGERAGRPIRFKEDDVEAVRELGLIKYASPEYIRTLVLASGNRQTSAAVRGVAPEYAVMRSELPETGSFITAEDVEKRRRVVFLGSEVARKLFGNNSAVGETVRLNGMSFEVIGVITSKVQMGSYYSPDKYCAFIPYTTVGQLWDNQFLYTLVFQTLDPSMHEQAVRQVRATLASRHGFDPRDERAVEMNDSVRNIETLSGITGGLKVVLSFIGSLTLMIGGVGVMNIMLVSVTERTREIGIRKAMGARRRHILTQFLMEGVAITFLGGVIGVILSYSLVALIRSRPFLADLLEDPTGKTDVNLILSPDVLLVATSILIFVGLLSGLWPALRASRMDPIESLRYE
jgi:putative ABC transport system permease protein